MKILNNLNDVSKKPKAVTIGNFDGIHKGHQALINKTKEISTENKVCLLYTSDAADDV